MQPIRALRRAPAVAAGVVAVLLLVCGGLFTHPASVGDAAGMRMAGSQLTGSLAMAAMPAMARTGGMAAMPAMARTGGMPAAAGMPAMARTGGMAGMPAMARTGGMAGMPAMAGTGAMPAAAGMPPMARTGATAGTPAAAGTPAMDMGPDHGAGAGMGGGCSASGQDCPLASAYAPTVPVGPAGELAGSATWGTLPVADGHTGPVPPPECSRPRAPDLDSLCVSRT